MNIDFSKFSEEEIMELLGGFHDPKYIEQLGEELNREKNELLRRKFGSGALPDFRERNSEVCEKLCEKLDLRKLPDVLRAIYSDNFFLNSSYFSSFDNLKIYSLKSLNDAFSDDIKLRYSYENTYNSIRYLINSIYRYGIRNESEKQIVVGFSPTGKIIVRSNQSIDMLIADMQEKKDLIYGVHNEVIEYLQNTGKSISEQYGGCQYMISIDPIIANDALIEAVAFGCSLDELKDKNFEGAKKLVYVPRMK